MSRSPGKSRSDLYSHTHSRGRAPSLYARPLMVVMLGLAGSPVLPFVALHAQAPQAPQKPAQVQNAQVQNAQVQNPQVQNTQGEAESGDPEKKPLREQISQQISERISELADSSYTVREEAGRAIVEFGSAALPELRRALGSTDAEVRRRAEELISEISRRARQLEERADPRLSRLRDRLPELTDPAFGEAVRRLDRVFRQFDQFEPPSTDRLRSRMSDFDRQFEERIAELEERMRRSFQNFEGARGEMSRRSIEERLFGEGGFDSFFGRGDSDRSTRSRVQIWRDGEPVLDQERTFEFSEIAEWGVALEPLHPALRSQLQIPTDVGLLVGEVLPRPEAGILEAPPVAGSSVEEKKAGTSLEQYDILLKINDQPVTDIRRLRGQLRAIDGLDPLRVELLRGGKTVNVNLPRAGVR